jgi:hypothetical protein
MAGERCDSMVKSTKAMINVNDTTTDICAVVLPRIGERYY